MLRLPVWVFLLTLAAPVVSAVETASSRVDALEISHQRFVLDNGLTVLVHTDRSVPIVAVNIWYKVGSRDEQPGRTGFAHLFEHFFFNGSENYPFGFREAMDDLGANNRNGTTNTDRTNFFEDVPVSALERTLYLEADRMGFLSGHISEEMLERERGVVKNEKRQGENQPYGGVFTRIVEAIYPTGHPYSWSTIGRMEDLDAASLDDIKQSYTTYYGPGNAVLALAGDISAERARELVERYFGAIKPSVPLARLESAPATLAAPIRDRMQDRVPQSRIYRVWHVPPQGARETHAMELLASALAASDSARLDRRLRFESELATNVGAFVWSKQLGSAMIVQASLRSGADADSLETGIESVLQTVIADGLTADELERARSRILSQFARGIERLGGFGGRSDVLAGSEAMLGSSEAYRQRLQDIADISVAEVQSAAARWLSEPSYTLWVDPLPERSASNETIDRSVLPALGDAPDVSFPEMQRLTLDNGLKVLLMRRAATPLVQISLLIDAGSAADPSVAPGTSEMALQTLLKGSGSRDAFAIADRRDALGATLRVDNSLDHSEVSMSALRDRLDDSLALLADVVQRPRFADDMVELQRKQQLAAIAQQKASPVGAALRLAPPLLYGPTHPYGQPWRGLGSVDVVTDLQRDDLVRWHRQWFVPGNATLVLAGDLEMQDIEPLLRRQFGQWKRGPVPEKTLPQQTAGEAGKVYLLDKPGAQQSVIVAAHLTSAGGGADDLALEVAMRNFGGMATSRLNRNLRLDKHWSYGTSGSVQALRGPRAFLVIAPVQTDKTREALLEVAQEIRDVDGERPLAGEEFDSIMRSSVSRLPGRFETLSSLVSAAVDVVSLNREPAYYYDYDDNLRALSAADINSAAAAAVDAARLTWIVIGDLDVVRAEIEKAALGEIVVLDSSAL